MGSILATNPLNGLVSEIFSIKVTTNTQTDNKDKDRLKLALHYYLAVLLLGDTAESNFTYWYLCYRYEVCLSVGDI